MNYLSFDVGIQNLAYCELSPEKEIQQWGIINMNNSPQCDVKLRKQCEKNATYQITDTNLNVKYCCTAHSKKFPKKKKLNGNRDILELSKRCIEKLRELDLSSIKYVLIENQPALKNPVMKSIQMIIYTFFVIDGVMDPLLPMENIYMVNARNKLKVYKGPYVICPYPDEKKNKYRINKYLSIKYTQHMIEQEEEKFKDLFENSKKKDDLADAYLQGIYWIEK